MSQFSITDATAPMWLATCNACQ